MLPKKELNIYPKNEKNIEAIMRFYFDEYDIMPAGIKRLMERPSLSLNQIEFIIRNLHEAYLPFFRINLKGEIDLVNLMTYGIDALINTKMTGYGSAERTRITLEFRDFVRESEAKIDVIQLREISDKLCHYFDTNH